MPIFGNHDAKGDLYVEYNVVLPLDISSDMRRSKFQPFDFATSL
jgi:DnaJ-related protein SCJ1